MTRLVEVLVFLNQCVAELGLAFHPDNLFEDYLSDGPYDDAYKYTVAEAGERNTKMEQCFKYCSEHHLDLYDLCLNLHSYREAFREFKKSVTT